MTDRDRPIYLLAIALAAGFAAPGEAQVAAKTVIPYLKPQKAIPTEDQVAIIDLIARMNQAIDANDYPAYAGFYTTDGVIDSGFGPKTVGRAAIIESLNQSVPFITNKRHVAGNVVLNRVGQMVTAVYYLTVFERASGMTLAGTAMITDEFRKTNGRWEVVSHTTRMDPATLAAMSAAMSK